jgi:hypothetical protein
LIQRGLVRVVNFSPQKQPERTVRLFEVMRTHPPKTHCHYLMRVKSRNLMRASACRTYRRSDFRKNGEQFLDARQVVLRFDQKIHID